MKKKLSIFLVLIASLLVGCSANEIEKIEKVDNTIKQQVEENIDYDTLTVKEAFSKADKLNQSDETVRQAYDLYKWASEQEPQHPTPYIGMANCYYRVGNYEKARVYLEQAELYLETAEISANSLASLYAVQGRIYGAMWRYEGDKYQDKAIEAYETLLDMEGLDEKTKQYYIYSSCEELINIYTRRSETKYIDECITLALEQYELNDSAIKSYTTLTGLYSLKGEGDIAKKYMNKVLPHLDKESANLLHAQYFLNQGNWQQAKPYLEKVKYTKLDNSLKANYCFIKVRYSEYMQNKEDIIEAIEGLLEISPVYLNSGVVQEYIQRNDITVDEKYYEQLAEEKEEHYTISLE